MQTLIDQYIDTYMTSRLERAKAAYAEVETRLTNDYNSQVQARSALMAQAKALRDERVVIDEAMIKWRKLQASQPNLYSKDSATAKEIDELWKTLRSAAIVDAQIGSADAQRSVDIEIAQVEKLFEVPDQLAGNIEVAKSTALGIFKDILATEKDDATASTKINDATWQYVEIMNQTTAGLNKEARLAAAARVAEDIAGAYNEAGVPVPEGQIPQIVAQKFGIDSPEMVSTAYVEKLKQEEKDRAQKKAYGNRALNTETWKLARERLDKILGKEEAAKLEARARIAAQFSPEQWRAVKEDLLDNGVIDTVDEASRALYEQAKQVGGIVPGEDEIFFDDLFIEQLRRRGRLNAQEQEVLDAAGRINPVAPTPDDIRKGASKLPYAPKNPTLGTPRKDRPAPLAIDKNKILSDAYDMNQSRIVHEATHPQAKRVYNQISQGALKREDLFETARKITQTADETKQLVADVMFLDNSQTPV